LLTAALLVSTVIVVSAQLNTAVDGNNGKLPTPPGLYVTPTAPLTSAIQKPLNPGLANYPNFVAGEAVKAVLSPDGTTLAILTAGQNSLYNAAGAVDSAASTQFIFLYDVTGANKTNPVLKQVLQQNNSYIGLVWAPNSKGLYAAGGCDDAVYAYTSSGSSFAQSAKISLGHGAPATGFCVSTNAGLGLSVRPNAAGLALSSDGKTLVVANNYNDSISVIDTTSSTVRYEYDLRPYSTSAAADGTKGGTFPYAVALNGTTAYVGADRDREVVVVNVSSLTAGSLVTRIPLDGNPNGMALSVDGTTLYVAQDNQDQVAVISTASNTVTRKIDTRGPASLGLPANTTGAAPTAVTINPTNNTLYAVNAGSNSVAVIPLTGTGALTTTGLIPTAYDPTDIAFSADGSWMYIVNGKSDTGPNPGYGYGNLGSITYLTYPGGNAAKATQLRANNQYQFQLEHATLVSAQVPSSSDLSALTAKVATNNGYSAAPNATDAQVMSFLNSKIKHVIYIVKENRTFDQILGDLGNGSDGDPSLVLFGRRVTPSFHAIAQNFVTLDNFMDPGDGSMDGWSWSTQGRVTNTETVTQQINYAAVNRGLSYESEGTNRSVPVNLPTVAGRNSYYDPTGATTPYSTNTASLKGGTANLLAGDGDHAATDSPSGYQQGYIFNAVLNAGGTVRDYGFMVNNVGSSGTIASPIKDPFGAGIVQVTAAKQVISQNGFYDPYFRGYDNNYSDVWRYNEWKREFDQFVANGNLPSLEMVRLSHDHTGNFSTALGGVNTPELQEADDDYAVGLLVQAVANSPYANSTVIISVEDDCQDGADHIDSHRSTTYVVGAYVKKNTVVSTRYSQPSVLRTIEDLLGTKHLNLNTAYTRPMADVFDITSSPNWTFTAIASTLLKQTTIAMAPPAGTNKILYAEGPDLKPTHNAKYWAAKTRGFDFSVEDNVPADRYNKILWVGLKGTRPPVPHSQFQSKKDNDGDDKDDK
jgi:DNA-binding beta-propeller fold protein YncE